MAAVRPRKCRASIESTPARAAASMHARAVGVGGDAQASERAGVTMARIAAS
jgi:hypothetical protein